MSALLTSRVSVYFSPAVNTSLVWDSIACRKSVISFVLEMYQRKGILAQLPVHVVRIHLYYLPLSTAVCKQFGIVQLG